MHQKNLCCYWQNFKQVNCKTDEPFVLDADEQLARIEVFNSLAVTAPQIELDRLRSDRRFNGTGKMHHLTKINRTHFHLQMILSYFYIYKLLVDEYSYSRVRPTPSEGTLCLSTSKLALAFCILGMIFLIAVIVAICCLIWGKSKSSRWVHGSVRGATTSVFSSR